MRLREVVLVLLFVCTLAEENQEAPSLTDKQKELRRFVVPPPPPGVQYFYETFSDSEQFEERWVTSKASKDGVDKNIAKYDGDWVLESPTNAGALDGDTGLVMKTAAKHYAIAAKLTKPFVFDSDAEAFVVQYEINFQDAANCAGAYVKLLSVSDDLSQFHDKTPYSIMFGPDKCGQSSKIHFIIRFKNPVTGEIEEKHAKQTTEDLNFFNDRRTHLFTLIIRANGNYAISLDLVAITSGTLQDDFTPSLIPPKEIDDPEDKKPVDWDDRQKIPDPDASKPDDWDEDAPPKIPDPDAVKPEGWLDDAPDKVPDPAAEKPADWDDDEDGDWEAPLIDNPQCEEIGCGEWKRPMIANPAYKGKWRPPMIDNVNYSGVWAARKIPNPGYFDERDLFSMLTPISAIGLELWTMSANIMFDNFLITNELTAATTFAKEGFERKYVSEQEATGVSGQLGNWMNYFTEMANEYPYMWALYAVAIVLPFVLCAACCVKSKKSAKPDEAALRKKTDAPSPDDPKPTTKEKKEEKKEEEEAKKEDEGGDKEEDKDSQVEEEEATSSQEGGDEGEEDGEKKSGKEEEEEEQVEVEEEQKPRKRGKKKTRRED